MSDIRISSSTSLGAGSSVNTSISTANGSTSINTTSSSPTSTVRAPAGSSMPNAGGLDTGNRSDQTIGATTNAFSMTLEQVDHNQMSTFVLALIASLFGNKKKEEDDTSKLLGLLMLSAMQQPMISEMSYYESYTSQTTQTSTATSSNAVQGTSYTTGGSMGAKLNTSA